VVDHAESPSTIISEIARVLRPGGVLYFAVNIHHPFYALASSLHGGLQVIGLPFEITPFADHTTHFTLTTAHRLFKDLPLRILYEHSTIPETKAGARQMTPRHPGDLLKRLFFKNARFEVVAVRET
jgi:SAM-dependent methyltransferase